LTSLRGEAPFPVGNENCSVGPRSVLEVMPFEWNSDGSLLFVHLTLFEKKSQRTAVLPFRSSERPEGLWPKGLHVEDDVVASPGARIIDAALTYPGPTAAAYLTWRASAHSNLYRIRIPN